MTKKSGDRLQISDSNDATPWFGSPQSRPAPAPRSLRARTAPAALSCIRGGDRHKLIDRRGEIPVRGWNGLAILPHHLQTQLDRLPRVGLRFFQGFAISNDRGQLGAGDREPAFGFGPE